MRNRQGDWYSSVRVIQLFLACWCLLQRGTTRRKKEILVAQDYSTNHNNPTAFVEGFVVKPTTRFNNCGDVTRMPTFPSATNIKNFNDAMPATSLTTTTSRLAEKPSRSSSEGDSSNNQNFADDTLRIITKDPKRSFLFSALMSVCGAGLGPFLDSYHSAFGVLKYDEPFKLILWGNEAYPALTTTWWVPELFGLAGFLIGWLYILLDAWFLDTSDERRRPLPPKILVGISYFTLQYWLSGVLVQTDVLDRTGILNLMSVLAAVGFLVLDGTFSGLIVSLATCLGGPLIEAGLITITTNGILSSGYHYTDLGETGLFPLWIIPVYFLGGPANGNLARGFWNALSDKYEEATTSTKKTIERKPCDVCDDTRRTMCPNCDGVGTYVAMGNRIVKCTSCNARGFVMCRACFDQYGEDPYDINTIRETMNRMPD
jgi:hypothetical protein